MLKTSDSKRRQILSPKTHTKFSIRKHLSVTDGEINTLQNKLLRLGDDGGEVFDLEQEVSGRGRRSLSGDGGLRRLHETTAAPELGSGGGDFEREGRSEERHGHVC